MSWKFLLIIIIQIIHPPVDSIQCLQFEQHRYINIVVIVVVVVVVATTAAALFRSLLNSSDSK
jgi:uncharacterized membrane protein